MRITDLLNPKGIQLHAAPADKASAIDLLVDLQEKAGHIHDKAQYKKDIWAREELDSTAVENGVAVPHVLHDRGPGKRRGYPSGDAVPTDDDAGG